MARATRSRSEHRHDGSPSAREHLQQMAALFDLLSDPTRLQLLVALSEVDELCVSDLAAQVEVGDTAVSHALRLLRAHDVVRTRREGNRIYYSLVDEHVRLLVDATAEHLPRGALIVGGHSHAAHGHAHDHTHGDDGAHRHRGGLIGILSEIFAPHSHDAADSIDDALESDRRGIRAVKISFAALMATTLLQVGIIVISGSVALLADTIHNFSDALTAVPLFIAFRMARKPANKRFTYGYGRAEDLAGLFVIAMITLSAAVAAVEAVRRLLDPQGIDHVGWVALAGVVGFVGNELVALYRIREGRAIGSAALVADGYHARTDGFTSLAVVAGAAGTWAGWTYADPVAGLVISIAILAVLRTAIVEVVRRLLNAVDPSIVDQMEHAIGHVQGVRSVESVQVRWEGHRLRGDVAVWVDPELTLTESHHLAHEVEHQLQHAVRHLDTVIVHVGPEQVAIHS